MNVKARNIGFQPVPPADILSAVLLFERVANPLGAQAESLCSAF
jgi:hypothetical protein